MTEPWGGDTSILGNLQLMFAFSHPRAEWREAPGRARKFCGKKALYKRNSSGEILMLL